MSDLARSEPRNSRSAGGARLPVLGAAGGNVGFAVHAKRSAQTTSIQRVDVVRCSYAPRDNACRIVVPRAKTSLSKLLTHRDKIRNGQGHATPLPQDGQETPPSAMIGMPRRTSLRLPCHCANMNSVAPGTGSRLPGSRRLQRPSSAPDHAPFRGGVNALDASTAIPSGHKPHCDRLAVPWARSCANARQFAVPVREASSAADIRSNRRARPVRGQFDKGASR